MQMPPVTLTGVLRMLSEQPTLGLRIARGWILVGALVAVLGSAMAVAHFVYGVPVQDKNTGMPATDGEVLAITSMLAGRGALFGVLGVALRSWVLRRPKGS
jgi:hypothetical protein